jgi:hypothetical protein
LPEFELQADVPSRINMPDRNRWNRNIRSSVNPTTRQRD